MRELTKPIPTYEECRQLWKDYQTPNHVIRHCKAVSRTAVLIGRELNRRGYHLNLPLIAVAGWLHDMMRLSEEHGVCAARELRAMGCDQVADIVAIHMSYRRDPEKRDISETDLICFADRTVKEDRFVGLEERMEYIIDKSIRGQRPEAEPRIRESFRQAAVFQQQIEEIIGKNISDIEHMQDEIAD